MALNFWFSCFHPTPTPVLTPCWGLNTGCCECYASTLTNELQSHPTARCLRWKLDHLSEETEPLTLDPGLQTSNVQLMIPAPSLVRRHLSFISRFYTRKESRCCYVAGGNEEGKWLTGACYCERHTPRAENPYLPDVDESFVWSKLCKACAWDRREWDQVGSFLASPRFLICLPLTSWRTGEERN